MSYDTNRYKLDVPPDKEVRWIKQLLRHKTGSNTGEKFVLHHGRIELQDDWVLSKLTCSIPPGSTIHCTVCKNKLDIEVELSYSGKRHSIVEEFYKADTVHDLKCQIQFSLGLPVSCFSLYCDSHKMHTNQKLNEFDINAPAIIMLASWKRWDKFLWCATEGRTKQLSGSMENDRMVRKYQQQVALFVAAHYNHVDMASHLLQLGAFCNKPAGIHPGQIWHESLKTSQPELMTPVFHAAAKGNLDVLRLFLEAKPDLLNDVNSQEHTLVDVVLKHGHFKCVEYMKTVKLRSRCRGCTVFKKYSYVFKLIVKLVRWRKLASSRLKPYKLYKQKRMKMMANLRIEDMNSSRLMRPEKKNVQTNKPKYQEHPTQKLAATYTSFNAKLQSTCYGNNCLSNNTSPTSCELSPVSSIPSISKSSVFSSTLNSMSLLSTATPLSGYEDSSLQKGLPPLRDSTSPLDKSGAVPKIKVKKYDKYLFDRQHYNKMYGSKVLNNQSLYSLALRCMETAHLSCHKKSWMQQLQVAVSLGKSNVVHPKITVNKSRSHNSFL